MSQQEKDIFKIIAIDSILQNMPGHVYWKNSEGVYLAVNRECCEYLRMAPEDIVNKTDFDFLSKEEAEKVRAVDMMVMESGTERVTEESDRDKCYFITKKTPLRDFKENVIGILGVSLDITKQKMSESNLKLRTQELAKALEAREIFIRNVNHEIRTPLQTMISVPESLQANYDILTDEQRKRCIDATVSESKRLMNLVSNILDLSKFREGRFILEFEKHSLKQMIEEVLREFSYSHGPIDCTIDGNVQDTIRCDKARMQQVLRNLINNSVKHGGRSKPISITVSNFKDKDDLSYVKFSIKDEGAGIPKGEEEAIFDAFVESSHTRKLAGGIGLGLSIVREIIDSHKGRIWVDKLLQSEIGTRMSFILPV